MGIVIGPIDLPNWITLQMLNNSIKYMKDDKEKYKLALLREEQLYKSIKDTYIYNNDNNVQLGKVA
jgi:hypothetical protein